ncbi:hypothetical protein C8R46DRAFT_1222885 [Mycena filopes]|nr:hypothetical protein C8R46DRAFT_1222885 [Mycena filopes]
MAKDYENLTLFDFYEFNPEIKPDCANLGNQIDYCVGQTEPTWHIKFMSVPRSNTVPTPNSNCSEYIEVAANDSCQNLGSAYKFNDEQFAILNGGMSCNALTGPGTYVCVRPINIEVYPGNTSAFLTEYLQTPGITVNGISTIPRPPP